MANLIVEDKTGLETSNVYASVREFQKFAELIGLAIDDIDDDQLAVFLVRATHFIDSLEPDFVGKRLNPMQALAFPRVESNCGHIKHLYDMRGLTKALFYAVEAQCLGFSLLPTSITRDDIVTKEKIEGALEVQYDSSSFKDVLFGKFPMVERYLRPYLKNTKGVVEVGR